MAAYNIEDLVISLEWTLGGEDAMLQAPIFACLPRVQCAKCFGGFHEALQNPAQTSPLWNPSFSLYAL